MPSLAYFTSPTLVQTATQSYGSSGQNKFNISSPFTSTGDENLYAVLKGTILLQQQTDVNKVNLILRPHDTKEIKLPIKYIIYRGLKTSEFLESTSISDPANKVKTSGSELLTAMQAIQAQRAPGTAIPVEALFGNELTPAITKDIDEFFFKNLAVASQLFTIDCGVAMGKFAGEASIEIILENPEFFVTVDLAKRAKHEIDITSISDPVQKKWNQDLVRNFVDPAAFYGFHYDVSGGIEYRPDISTKLIANTPGLVYQNIVQKFSTKNKVYLDIRNENGYSYNYYNNYQGIGADLNKNIKIGQSPSSLINKEYYSSGWAIHSIDVTPGSTSENEIFLALRINDNARPLIAGWNIPITPNSIIDPPLSNAISKRVYFTDETQLLPVPIPSSLPEFTNVISFKIPNILGSPPAQMATIIRLDYIKQLLPMSTSNIFKKQNFTDYMFGPLDSNIPWDLENKVQWFTSDHISYIDALQDGYVLGKYKTTVLSADVTSNEIEIFDEVPVDVSQVVIIENNTTNTQNVGTYTIAGIRFLNGKTFLKLKESLPGALQIGDKVNLTVKIDGSMDFNSNKFIIKNKNYINLEVLSINNRLNFYSHFGFSNSYDISNATYQNPNTEIGFVVEKKSTGLAGFAQTGVILETDTSTTSPDNDRVIYYACPLNYFSNNGITKSSSFNAKGGALNYESLLKGLEAIMPGVTIKKTKLIVGSDNILTFSYDTKSKAKEALFLLGLTKTELATAQTATTVLSSTHIKLFKLSGSGQSKIDASKNTYYQYDLLIAGFDSSGAYLEVASGISIYTLDHIIFTSKQFAAKYDIDTALAGQNLNEFVNEILGINGGSGNSISLSKLNVTNEERNNLEKGAFWTVYGNGKPNKDLFKLDPTMKDRVVQFKSQLDAVQEDAIAVETLLKTKGADLLNYGKTRIKEVSKPYTNKDGILYLTRLIMKVILKNHPKLLTKFPSKIDEFSDLFEKHSRGLEGTEKPSFGAASSTQFNILISGFDPFSSMYGLTGFKYYDTANGYQSNPSGNVALALDGQTIVSNGKTATIKSAIVPVRFKEFNDGWIETFFTPYVNDNNIKMIITFSYGIDGSKYSFEMERFAARKRGIGAPGNDMILSTASSYLEMPDKDSYEFIETTLPFNDMFIDKKVGLDQKAVFDFYENGIKIQPGYINNTATGASINRTIYPFDNAAKPFNNDLKASYYNSPIKSINLINYSPLGSGSGTAPTANKIISEEGSGGNYLSNEIYYRVAFLRATSANPSKLTGHIHVGFLNADPMTDRTQMLTIIKDSIKQALDHF